MNQMKQRTISALIAVAVVGVAMAVPARSSRAEPAADDCLEQPSGAAPQGSHWYYRTDRSTNRRCWRLAPQRERRRRRGRSRRQNRSRLLGRCPSRRRSRPPNRSSAPPRRCPMSRCRYRAFRHRPLRRTGAGCRAAIEPEPEPSIDRDAGQQPAAPPQHEAGEQNGRPSMEAAASADDPGAAAASDLELEHMLALVAAALVLAAVIVRKVFKLFTVRRLRRRRSLLRSDWEAAGETRQWRLPSPTWWPSTTPTSIRTRHVWPISPACRRPAAI